MDAWRQIVPSTASDGSAVLLFAVMHMLHAHVEVRSSWRRAQAASYKRIRAAKAAEGCTPAELDEYGPNWWQRALDTAQQRGNTFVGLFGASVSGGSISPSQASSHSELDLALLRVGTWAYCYFTCEEMFPVAWTGRRWDTPADCAHGSAALRLRATCRSWSERLRFVQCCKCGHAGPPSSFDVWYTFPNMSPWYGGCECAVCDSLLLSHIICGKCGLQRQAELAGH